MQVHKYVILLDSERFKETYRDLKETPGRDILDLQWA